MNFRVVSKDSFKIVGIKQTSPLHKIGVFVPEIDRTLHEHLHNYFEQETKEKANEIIYMAVYHTDHEIDYYIGFETTAECPESLVELIVLKQKWAVFELSSISSQALDSTWYYLFTDWFPANGYELVANAEFFRVLQLDSAYELWVPVINATRNCE